MKTLAHKIADLIVANKGWRDRYTDAYDLANLKILELPELKAIQMQAEVSDDCERLYISEFDYFVDGQKKYYHIKVINKTDKFIEFEWVWSGSKQLMSLKRFNEIYKIEEELASNSR